MIYVVLGMHKSGTTLVSQILHHSGINMDDTIDADVSYDKGNKYERQSVLHTNMAILGTDSYNILKLEPPPSLDVSEGMRAGIAGIVQDCQSRYADWGFKDPRTCLTYPIWAGELPEHRIIAVYRDASEVWPRYRARSWKHYFANYRRAWYMVNRWCEHTAGLIATLEATPQDYIVLNYRELMTTDREFDRLQEFVGISLEDRRRKDLYRSKVKSYLPLIAADRIYRRRNGYGYADLMTQLDAIRARG